MPERLVDVEKQGAKVLHTFPVTISAPAVEDEAFKEKALEAAGNAKLVPNEELEGLNAKMHDALLAFDSASRRVWLTNARPRPSGSRMTGSFPIIRDGR
jgi:hypothetical protein